MPARTPEARSSTTSGGGQVDIDPGVALGVWRPPGCPSQLARHPAEQRLGLDRLGLDPAGTADDLIDPTDTVGTQPEMHDQVDASRDGRHNEAGPQVSAKTSNTARHGPGPGTVQEYVQRGQLLTIAVNSWPAVHTIE